MVSKRQKKAWAAATKRMQEAKVLLLVILDLCKLVAQAQYIAIFKKQFLSLTPVSHTG